MSSMDKIKHVVVLCLENRGFDHLVGWLYSKGDEPPHVIPEESAADPFFGLDFVDLERLKNTLRINDEEIMSEMPAQGTRAFNTPDWNPHEEYHEINHQFFGSREDPDKTVTPPMNGFLSSFATLFSDPREEDQQARIRQIMECYIPSDLPTISGLAKFYSISDKWFSSVPTQTNANRAFLTCGTSLGLVDNGFFTDSEWWWDRLAVVDRFRTKTIWNVLHDDGDDD